MRPKLGIGDNAANGKWRVRLRVERLTIIEMSIDVGIILPCQQRGMNLDTSVCVRIQHSETNHNAWFSTNALHCAPNTQHDR